MKKLGLHDTLETQRCILKIPEESEAEYIWNLITSDTIRYMIWEKGDDFSTTLKNIKKTRIKVSAGEAWDAAIYDKNTGKHIGRCGINKIDDTIPSFELGYWIAPEYYGQGIMPECIRRYLKFAFEQSSFEKGVIRCDSKNENSKKVALKCGFTLEGEFKNHDRVKGELRDTSFYGITRQEYEKFSQ
ncbi:GNAT family N-acetyltransferase [Candidatus Gracilibacteria bacterium]|nr:GNAT family N-acetyltransferase [Candidatus Gracilibacteria bacterium]